ncbi:MAG: hypothetical protein KF690_07130 [Bacteroidetes bacterium]|nr:hypothetical protein [Bacteroidota bacterium]
MQTLLFRYKPARLLLLGLLCCQWLLLGGCEQDKRPLRYVAYVGRYTNANDTLPPHKQKINPFDQMNERIFKTYLEELNELLPQCRLELRTYDCQQSARGSDSVYKLIAADTMVLAVIDNTWGVNLAGAQETIRKEQLPVIALNADHNHLDYGSASIFTGNSDNVPLDLASYIHYALREGSVNFITERDYALTQTYYTAFKQHDIVVNRVFEVQTTQEVNPDSLARVGEAMLQFYRQNPAEKKRLLVLNVHNTWGNALIKYLDKHLDGMRLMGHAYIANANALQGFGASNTNTIILITNPTDALSRKSNQDLKAFQKEDAELFSHVNVPLFIKRCLDATSILQQALLPPRPKFLPGTKPVTPPAESPELPPVPTRRYMRQQFAALGDTTLAGELDIYTFDSSRVLVPDIYFSQYSQGKLFSMAAQLNQRREVIPNLLFGIEIQDIYDLDIASNSFTCDFYYWVKLDTSHLDAEKYISFQNMKSSESSRELIIEKQDGPQVYKLYRVSGIFYVNYSLFDFPFDTQELAVNVEILSPADKLKISFDQSSLLLDPEAIEKFKVTGWNKEEYYVTVDNMITRSIKGDPQGQPGTLKKFKTFAFRLVVKRIVLGSYLQIVLPLVLIGLIAIAVLFITDLTFENVGEVSVGIFLSIIAFSISLTEMIPSSNYLTRADMLFWLTFIVVFVSFMAIIVLNSLFPTSVIRTKQLKSLGTFLAGLYPLLVLYVLFG